MTDLAWLIPLFPLAGFLISGLLQKFLRGNAAGVIGSAAVFLSFLFSALIFSESIRHTVEHRIVLFEWMAAGAYSISFAFYIDHLTILMLLIVTGVGFLIHVYSIGYMKGDPGFARFFSYLNLFMFSMLMLVMAGNYVIMFIGWEGVGLCSYLLIGFWWKNENYTAAGNKAFIMNRIGDLGFILGIFLMLITFGSTEFETVFNGTKAFSGGDETIFLICILLFIGAVGKSAQIPLATWLPDAMAGPTPVSALIHAATMVTAGIYMVARSHLLYSLSPLALQIVLITGCLTALWAALIAITQSDLKKVLAYSTVSQLGFMFAALGASAFDTGIFHVMTHAFFKALLFLGAGSVIHALHGEQNIRHMGALRGNMKITAYTFLAATLAISGLPPLSGFFSKDEILVSVYQANFFWFVILCLTAALTAVYMLRLYFMVFEGSFRGTEKQGHAIHESPSVITVPLLALAVLTILGGFIGLPSLLSHHHRLREYLQPVFAANPRLFHEEAHSLEIILIIATVVVLAIIVFLAHRRYVKRMIPILLEEKNLSFFYLLSFKKFYVDELYEALIVKPVLAIGKFFSGWVEWKAIGGTVNQAGRFTLRISEWLRPVQSGKLGSYLILMVAGAAFILIFSLLAANIF